MSYLIATNSTIDKVVAPNLPLAPRVWNRQYQDQFSNVLRLYFNRIDKLTSQLEVSSVDSNGIQTQLWLNNSGGFFSG
jgi:hypothetical protein